MILIRKTLPVAAAAACAAVALAAGDNLQYWLDRAAPAASQPAESGTTSAAATAPAATQPRDDAWPGAIELSDGTILAGMIHTTRDQPWTVYVEAEKRWRLIPPLAVLSITAVVREESYEQEWRWAGMGRSEKVYTGRRYPFRRFEWTFRLADGSEITGVVKGQPIWVDSGGAVLGPFVLHERDKGPLGSRFEELIYIKRVIVSRRAMEQALSTQPASCPTAD